jgi:hypothetical protein
MTVPDDAAMTGSDGAQPSSGTGANNRLVSITLDQDSIRRSNPNVQHEREVAIYDVTTDHMRSILA